MVDAPPADSPKRGDFSQWWLTRTPGRVQPLRSKLDWETLTAPFPPHGVLDRIYELITEHEVRSVLVEHRYIDLDYRSEHARFYSTTFQRYPSTCLRLHFFTREVAKDLRNLGDLRAEYRGYMVLRPLPPEVHLFGHSFSVTAMPFVSQDAQYLRCAHAVLWMVLYHSHLAHRLPRRLPGAIADASLGGQLIGRQLPSDGLSVSQMLGALDRLSLSPRLVRLPESRKDSDRESMLARRIPGTASEDEVSAALGLYDVLCRYVNSQTPPIVSSENHAWVIVGYLHKPSVGDDRLTLVRHDDTRGPYLLVDDPWGDNLSGTGSALSGNGRRPWLAAMIPLQQKIYMSAERAEALGEFWLRSYADDAPEKDPLRQVATVGNLRFRTYSIASAEYKGRAAGRLPEDIVAVVRNGLWPRLVWVVEAIDRTISDPRQARVLGEAILDATASDLAEPEDWGLLTLFGPSQVVTVIPDTGEVQSGRRRDTGPVSSGCPALGG